MATAEIETTSARLAPASHHSRRGLRALEAQRMIDLCALRLAPSLAAGLIAYSHTRRFGDGLIVFICVLRALEAQRRLSYSGATGLPACRPADLHRSCALADGGGLANVVVDALVERKLGFEVCVLAMAVGEVLSVEYLDEGFDHVLVELGAGNAAQFDDRLV